MASSTIEIWNLALSAAGGRGLVTSPSDKSREADLCRQWFPQVKDTIMKSASWPCGRKFQRLSLITEQDTDVEWTGLTPSPDWRYGYAEPSDMLAPRYLSTFARFDRLQFNGSTLIMTNQDRAILHYSADVDDVSRWDVSLTNAIIHTLASVITTPLTGKRLLARENREIANEVVLLAQTEVANEMEDRYDSMPSWIAARGYGGLAQRTLFFWPYESVTSGGMR